MLHPSGKATCDECGAPAQYEITSTSGKAHACKAHVVSMSSRGPDKAPGWWLIYLGSIQ